MRPPSVHDTDFHWQSLILPVPACLLAGYGKAWGTKHAPWNHANRAVLWPHPFSSFGHADEGGQHPLLQVAQGNTTHQLMHFVSYVLGAAGVQHLPPGQPRVNTA
jgi:hypothetical protein